MKGWRATEADLKRWADVLELMPEGTSKFVLYGVLERIIQQREDNN